MFKMLSPDSVLGRWLVFLLNVLAISMVWALCSLPVVTAGAANAALCRVALNWMRRREDCTVRTFLRTFRGELRRATGVWLVLLAVGALLGADLYLLWGADTGLPNFWRWLSLAVALVWLAWAGYAFMLEAAFDNPVGRTLMNALRFVPGRIATTFTVLLVDAAALLLAFLAPLFTCVIFCAAAFLTARVYWNAFLPLIPPELVREQEDDGEEDPTEA